MFHNKKLGELVAKKDLVVFSKEQVAQMALDANVPDKTFIEQYQGVVCEKVELQNFTVNSMRAVSKDGTAYEVIVIGMDQKAFIRFLDEKEPLFGEFLQKHPLFPEIKWDEDLWENEEIYAEICRDYQKRNLEAS